MRGLPRNPETLFTRRACPPNKMAGRPSTNPETLRMNAGAVLEPPLRATSGFRAAGGSETRPYMA